ncbi:hypothetical protein JCM5296_000104 [Sporobolomyces johnsonii]
MTAQPTQKSRLLRLLLILLVAIVVLAIALGVGLGVGLKHLHADGPSSATASTAINSSSSSLDGLVQQPSSNFVLKGAAAMAQEPAQTRTYSFVVEERTGAPDGESKTMLVVNGMFPGPTIEVNSDDRIVVNVTNMMPNATSIHWHGLYQRGTPYYDGTTGVTQCGIPSGSSLVYNFTLDGWYGTTWWHGHHGTQYTDGIIGALIVHPRNQSAPTYDGEISLQIGDLYHRFSSDLLQQYLSQAGMTGAGLEGVTQGNEPVPDAGTINGVGQWGSGTPSYSNYTLQPESSYRLRLANAGSFAAVRFSVDNHTLEVVEADGTDVEPYVVEGLVIDVAQRYSVVLRTNQTSGAYWMRNTIQEDAFTYTEEGFNGNQLGVIRYGVDNSTMPDSSLIDNDPGAGDGTVSDLDDSLLVPTPAQTPPNSTMTYYLSLSMQNDQSNNWLSFINTTSWSPLVGAATLFGSYGNETAGVTSTNEQLVVNVPDPAANEHQVVDIVIGSLDDGDHDFHLHGYKVWIMGSGAGRYQGQELNYDNPMR